MNTFVPVALAAMLAAVSLPAAGQAAEPMQQTHVAPQAASAPAISVAAGKLIYDAKGRLIAPVYHVTDTGLVQVILEDQLVTIPAQTLSENQGKVVTSLTKADLLRAAH